MFDYKTKPLVGQLALIMCLYTYLYLFKSDNKMVVSLGFLNIQSVFDIVDLK